MPHLLSYPFANVYAELPKISSVDGLSGGASPITFRWLTLKNRYVNIGLQEVGDSVCEIKANNNSFGVSPDEIKEIFEAVLKHMDSLPKPLPDLRVKEYKTSSKTVKAAQMTSP